MTKFTFTLSSLLMPCTVCTVPPLTEASLSSLTPTVLMALLAADERVADTPGQNPSQQITVNSSVHHPLLESSCVHING